MRKLKDRPTKARSALSKQTSKHPKLFVILFTRTILGFATHMLKDGFASKDPRDLEL